MFKRLLLATVALGALAASTAFAERMYYGYVVGVGDAPRTVWIDYDHRPEVRLIPGTRVYAVANPSRDCDMFRSGNYWYANCDGYWYRSASYRGNYYVTDVRRVPVRILTAEGRWSSSDTRWSSHPHGGPPGQTKKARVIRYR